MDLALERDGSGALRQLLREYPLARKPLLGVFGCSPHLSNLAARDPARLARLLLDAPERVVARLLLEIKTFEAPSEAELMRFLRLAKQEAALLVGLADLTKAWDTMTATRSLTDIADAALRAAVAFTLREAAAAGKLEPLDARDPEKGSGWIFLAMGKQGAFELNYSSDIDLVVFFDRQRARPRDPGEDVDLFVKLTSRVVKIMSERTADGYVFRVDLRLRPDPGATPIALPLEAAYSYYESMGQNWERAAFIKARAVAGDIEAGETFLRELAPFIWRKYFDFAAIADVHSIKRQIHAHKGHGEIKVRGHDIKLGRGGIREIEFFAQTQQLIVGGRDKSLRGRETLGALERLARAGWIEDFAREQLTEAYLFLRDVEHRIQIIADEQRHALPDSVEGVAVVALMMGFRDYEDFAGALTQRLETVQGHYARLFERAPLLTSRSGNLVFTGDEDDPETLATLKGLGFANPKTVTETVRGWHFGRFPATRSAAARERLTELTPALLEALAATGDADAAFLAFDKFLAHLPAGAQLFALLISHPRLLELIATITGAAPKLARTLARRPRVLGALLEPAFYEEMPERADLAARLGEQLADAHSYEEALDRARVFGQEQKFLIGARLVAGALSARRAGEAYALLAEVVIAGLLERVEAEFARTHGKIPGGAAAVAALGKLGGREMTAASDLDLMLLYTADPAAESVGERPLPASQYYARLTQRLIAALSAPTAQGSLYDVDFRLRPSGKMGPLAVRLEAFDDYQINEAWTWEHMALTRARVIAGPADFAMRVNASIGAVLTRPCAKMRVGADVLEMRRLLEKEKPGSSVWHIKQIAGGQVDIEFITQFLLLCHGAEHPRCLATATVEALERLAEARLLEPGAARDLIDAALLYQEVTQILRLALDDEFDPAKASRGLVGLLLRATKLQEIQQLEQRLRQAQTRVRALFIAIVEG